MKASSSFGLVEILDFCFIGLFPWTSMPQWDVVLTSACFHSTFSWRESARLNTFFVTSQHGKAWSNFLKHGTSKVRKPEISWSFHIMSYLWFIVLWVGRNHQNKFYNLQWRFCPKLVLKPWLANLGSPMKLWVVGVIPKIGIYFTGL